MKIHLCFLILVLTGCNFESKEQPAKNSNSTKLNPSKDEKETLDKNTKRFRDSLYNRESDNYISKLEEINGKDSNAYKLTISQKNGGQQFTKILNTRPTMSSINYCNDLYTSVGFSCGGPCYSQVFVFTEEDRPSEQYSYGQTIKGHPNLIAHINDEEFEKLIIHNFDNGKELTVNIADIAWTSYGQMDTLYIIGNDLKIEYRTQKITTRKKSISLQKIIN